ncbi:MAG: hypothetical protein V1660_03585 [archaeon]
MVSPNSFSNPLFFIIDFISAIVIFVATLFFIRFFNGSKLKREIMLLGAGLILHALFHEFGEFVCRAGIHGGFPKTFWGSFHILILGSIGAIIFFIGSIMLKKRYSKLLE